MIIEYQKEHNAIGKAKIYSESLKEYVPFIANSACVGYIRQLDLVEEKSKDHSWFSFGETEEHIHEMELIDELEKYQQCAELLKKEIENLESFRR